MLNFTLRLLTVAWFLTITGHAGAALVTGGSVDPDPAAGSWFGGGIGAGEVIRTHGNKGLFSITGNFGEGASTGFNDGSFRSSDFAGPTHSLFTDNNGKRLAVGFYTNATGFPFNWPTHPGRNVSGNAGSPVGEVPIPGSALLLASGLVGVLSGVIRRKNPS